MMDIALGVGGCFLSAFLQVAFDRIASTRNFIDFFQRKEAMEFDEETLDKLEITLDTISIVLEDAENRQSTSVAVRRWLSKVKDVVNQADDLLDELNTECLRLKVDYEFQSSESKSVYSVVELFLGSEFIEKFMPHLKKITSRLEYYVKQISALGLRKFDPKEKCAYRASSSSVVDKSQIFGRDEEKEKLVQTVLSDEGRTSHVSVIAITGLGGVGKTTLAQLVYNDDRVKEKFLTTAWVCVSEEYDALRVTKSLLMEVNSDAVDDKDDFNRLQVKLRDCLVGKCFLIILDDMWNENYNDWHSLKNSLNHGNRGSKIIVTTRNEKVALTMQNGPFHHMQPIHEDESWSLFKSHALDDGDRTSLNEFETIGKEIVKKCKGLPLAIKTVAGALRPKRYINEWIDVLNSGIWDAGGDVLPSLNVSYKHLPSHLKSCFAFCAVFPKDIPFDKKEVILLWMANDLVRPSTYKSLEETGRDYFEDLRSRSLFEMVDAEKYLMHDLINDLARHVSGNFCARLQDYQDTDFHQQVQREIYLPREVLHFSYLATHEDTYRKFKPLAEVHNLRTFLPIHGETCHLTTLFFSDILPKFGRIRVLTLSGYSISVIPDSIGDLKHIRFINLARTDIRKLPNSIGKCLNLQTLILAYCFKLVELPKDMRSLINLRHLDVRSVGYAMTQRMSSWLSILKDIQNLSIVVDKIHGSLLDQFCKLQPSQSLIMTGLEKVVTFDIAKRVELKNKNCIEKLTLEWRGIAECSEDELNIFSILQPHTNTKQLSINGYGGTIFSNWLGDSAFSNMESLSLRDCKNCFFLPPLGQLVALKKLHISGLCEITEVGEKFYGNSSISKPFQALEELRFSKMSEWTTWNTHSDNVEFPSLKKMCIEDCPKLVGDIPFHLTSLRDLEIRGLPHLKVENMSNLLSLKKMTEGINHLLMVIKDCPTLSLSLQTSAIKELVIGKCKHVEFPTIDSFNSSLESLTIESCGDSTEAIPLCSCSKLRELYIFNMESPELFKFPRGYHQTITALHSLTIHHCNNILCFPKGGLQIPSLKEFFIHNCRNLKSLPEQMHTQLSSLVHLKIRYCPLIKCFPEGGLPPSLETLFMSDSEKLMSCQTSWGLQMLPSLVELYIGGVNDPLFPDEGLLPSTLQLLAIRECPNLEALNDKGLRRLTSLRSLWIHDCMNLRYFPAEKFSPFLSDMTIVNCRNIESFPEDGLTSSLSRLEIFNCPKLKARMKREKGEDWPKVSHIPLIYIDDEVIS